MPKTILIVDDSSSVRQQVANALHAAGFNTVEAEDGRMGAASIEQNAAIAMVVCDVNMPYMNGIEMVQAVKSKPQFSKLPILMLTTEGQPALIKQAKAAGAVGWMVKPFNAGQLVAAAKQLTQ